jgi:hypothetical protein
VVTGTVDMFKARKLADQGTLRLTAITEYVDLRETASASGAASAIQDIEVLKPLRSPENPGGTPYVSKIHMNRENLNSVSIEFSKYMDNDSVLEGLTFTDDDNGFDVPYLPVWTYQTLHLIPDISDRGLGDTESKGLDPLTNYTVTVATTSDDYYGTPIGWVDSADELTASILTRPDKGWYIGDTDTDDAALSSGQVAKFAGRGTTNWGWDYYRLATAPANFRLEFSARNLKWELLGITLHDADNGALSAYDYKLDVDISSWNAWGNYYSSTGYNNYVDYYDNNGNGIANGNWLKVKMEVFGNTYKLSVSDDGSNWTVLHEVSDMGARTNQELYLSVNEALLLDNLQLTTLDGSGNVPVATPVGDVLDEDFDSAVNINDIPYLVSETTDTVSGLN